MRGCSGIFWNEWLNNDIFHWICLSYIDNFIYIFYKYKMLVFKVDQEIQILHLMNQTLDDNLKMWEERVHIFRT